MSFTRFPNLIETIAREQTDSEDGRYVRRTSSRVRRMVSSELIIRDGLVEQYTGVARYCWLVQ